MRTLEIGLIGAGLIARIHLDAWARTGARVRVYATDDRAAVLAGDFGARAVDSLAEAIDGADAVDICTPTDSHRDIALAAIAAGVAVVCEKPLTVNSADAEKVVAAALAAGVPVFPAHNTRFAPAYARLHEMVAQGRLGTGTIARFTSTAHHPRAWTEPLSARSGGILTDQMLHGVDIAYWVFGPVHRVHAWYRGELAAPAPDGTVAVGTAVLTHASGAISHVVSGWSPPPTPVRGTFHVVGTGGAVSYDSAAPQELRVTGGAAAGVPGYFGESPFVAQIREFAAALTGGPPARLAVHDALAAVSITEAAAESAWTGQVVELKGTVTGR